eukprot:c18148_g1_i1 orf=402-3155(+)
MEKISVAVRVRPPSTSSESSKGTYWKIVDNTISLCSPLGTPVSGQAFAFDHVFGTEVATAAIYDLHTRGVISSALHGFNGTVFAYGQTSSGKTYTMRGSKTDLGLIGLAVHEVFSHIQKITEREFLIRVSYMEIYNEDIDDLLAPENRKLQVHENLEKGIFVAGLREEIVSSPKQVFELLEFGEARRHVGQTNMNVYSSRSHTIFRMVIESKDKNAVLAGACALDAVRVSVLNLVDLAGSERVAKTGAGGVRLKEGTHINKSLMTLGNVIKKLSDGAARQGGHIPYRDSKLTRILQPALGGNAKTAIICTIAPDEVHIDETRGTLMFASRAKRVTTCAQVNEIMTDAALLKRQQREIEDLRKKLKGFQSEVSEQEILRLRNDLLQYELEKEKLELELQEERKAQMEREQRIKEQELKIENLSSLVITSTFDDAVNKENGKHLENRPLQNNYQNSLITVRRDRHQSPLNFELLSDRSAERNTKLSKRELDFEGLLNFENVADEDLWATMNDGQSLAEPDFLFSTPSRWTSSVGSTKEGGSSSVIGALMSSRVKMERYKSQLEEAWKENSELRTQFQDQCKFQAELKSELIKLEKEFASSKSMSKVAEEFWDALKQAKSSFSARICDFLLTEKNLLESAFLQADKVRNVQVESLASKVVKLEGELSKCREENVKLQTQCQDLVEQVQCFTLNATTEEADVRSASPECDGDIKSKERSSIHGRLSNGESACASTDKDHLDSWQRMATKVPELDAKARSMQKDHSLCVSDDSWLKRKGNKDDSLNEDRTTLGLKVFVMANDDLNSPRHLMADDRNVSKDLKMATEMLLMSKEHIRALERQVLLANLEKDRTKALLKEQLDRHEKSVVAMKLQKKRFAEELKSIMEAIAIQDTFVTSICHGIQGFDKRGDFECPSVLSQVPL